MRGRDGRRCGTGALMHLNKLLYLRSMHGSVRAVRTRCKLGLHGMLVVCNWAARRRAL